MFGKSESIENWEQIPKDSKESKKLSGIVSQTLSNYTRSSGRLGASFEKCQKYLWKTREIKVRQIKLKVKKSSETRNVKRRLETKDG